MRRSHSFSLLAAATVSALITATSLVAQPVSVSLANGIHVRAPFASVDVFPGGGVRVRAPYTAVDIGGHSAYVVRRPVVRSEVFTPDDFVRLSDFDLWSAVRESSERFVDRMNGFDTGATWQRYLRLPDELQIDSYSGDTAQRDAAAKLLQRFDVIAADARYQKISSLPEFAAMRSALAELVKRPAVTGNANRTELLPAPRFEAAPAERMLLQSPVNPQNAP
jgi:hypothetical protein